MTGVSGVKSRKLYEVMDTITVTNHADIEFIVVVNSDWWAGLTDGQRKIISDAAGVAETSVRNKMSEIEAGAYEVAKANGMKVVVPSADDIAAFKAASGSVYDAYKAKASDLGAQLLEAASKMPKPFLPGRLGLLPKRPGSISGRFFNMPFLVSQFERLTLGFAWVAAWLFALSGAMLSYEVVARYFFLSPTKWAAELSQFV